MDSSANVTSDGYFVRFARVRRATGWVGTAAEGVRGTSANSNEVTRRRFVPWLGIPLGPAVAAGSTCSSVRLGSMLAWIAS